MTERPTPDFVAALALRGAGQIAQMAVQPIRMASNAAPPIAPGQGTAPVQAWRRAQARVFDEPLEADVATGVATSAQEPVDLKPGGTQPPSLTRIADGRLAGAQAEPRTPPQPAPTARLEETQATPGAYSERSDAVGEQALPQTSAIPAARVVDITVVPPAMVRQGPSVYLPTSQLGAADPALRRDNPMPTDQPVTLALPAEEAAEKPQSGSRQDEMAEPPPIAAPQTAVGQRQARAAPVAMPALADTRAPDASPARFAAMPDAPAMPEPAGSLPTTVMVQPAAAPARTAVLPVAAQLAAANPTVEVHIGAVEVRAIRSESTATLAPPAARPAPQPQGFAEYDYLRG